MLLKHYEGRWGWEVKKPKGRENEEEGKGGVSYRRGNENLQRGKAVTLLFNFTFSYRMFNLLMRHSKLSSNIAFSSFLFLTDDGFPSKGG